MRFSDIWHKSFFFLAMAQAFTHLSLAQTTCPAADSTLLHIFLAVKLPDGGPVEYLSQKAFDVSQGVRRMPISVNSPQYRSKGCSAIATRLLVLFGPAEAATPRKLAESLVNDASPVFEKKWEVAVGRIGGTVGKCATSAETFVDERKQASSIQTDAAMADLNRFPGRRVLLLVGGADHSGAMLPDQQLQQARDSLVDIFIVDGGQPPPHAPVGGDAFALAPSNAEQYPPSGPSVPVHPPEHSESYSKGVYHEPTLKDAMHAIQRTGFGFYELTLNIPASEIDVHNPISVKVNRRPPLLVEALPVGLGSKLEVKLSDK